MRIFYETDIAAEKIILSEENSRHIIKVLRMQAGDTFYVTDGKGNKALATISTISKKYCEVLLSQKSMEPNEERITLAIAFTKNMHRMEWLLEKITEIGIKEIYPIITTRSERSEIKKERLEKILVSAMMQSQRWHVPILHPAISFEEMLELSFEQKLIAHCEKNLLRTTLEKIKKPSENIVIMIGPEGDFTKEEITLAETKNYKAITLGNYRLRTETAALVGVVGIRNRY